MYPDKQLSKIHSREFPPTTQDIKDKCFIADYSIETESELKYIRALLDIETKIGSVYIMYTYEHTDPEN